MCKRLRSFLPALFCLVCLSGQAQTTADSLRKELQRAKNDTTRLNVLNSLGEYFYEAGSIDSAIHYFQLQIKQAEEKILTHEKERAWYNKSLGSGLNTLGIIKKQQGQSIIAMEYYQKALKAHESAGDLSGCASTHSNMGSLLLGLGEPAKAIDEFKAAEKIVEKTSDVRTLAAIYNNLGIINQNQGNISASIMYFEKARKVFDRLKDDNASIIVLGNIGYIYMENKEPERALEVFYETLHLSEKSGFKRGVCESLSNIGLVYEKTGAYAKAEDYFIRSLNMHEEMQNKKGMAVQYNNLGILFKRRGELKKAKDYYEKAYAIRKAIGDRPSILVSLTTMGSLFLEMNDKQRALACAREAMEIAEEIKFPEYTIDAASLLTRVHKALGNFQEALRYYDLSVEMKDSVSNERNRKAAIKSDLKYQYEKKAAADSVKNAEARKVEGAQMEAQAATLRQKRIQFWFLGGGLLVIIAGLIFVVSRFRITQMQKKIIERQKTETDLAYEKLHQKNKEILDSIYYARRIQQTIITNEKYISTSLKKLSEKK